MSYYQRDVLSGTGECYGRGRRLPSGTSAYQPGHFDCLDRPLSAFDDSGTRRPPQSKFESHYDDDKECYYYRPIPKSLSGTHVKLPSEVGQKQFPGSFFDDHAYIQSIIDTYHSTEDSSQVLNHGSLPHVKITLGEDYDANMHSSKAPFRAQWRFQVRSADNVVLKRVSMLCSDQNFRFTDLSSIPLNNKAVPGSAFLLEESTYLVSVDFECSSPGIFKQWICFDFGAGSPFLVRQLHVFVGGENDPAFKVERFRFENTVEETDWNNATVNIVPSDWPAYDRKPAARQLLARWKPLGAALENDAAVLRSDNYGPDNYKNVMHSLIRMEEASVAGAIGRIYIDSPVMEIRQSPDGYGFEGFITLGQALDPRTRIGSLTMKNASRMLLAFKDFTKSYDEGISDEDELRRVYEADIIEKQRGNRIAGSWAEKNIGDLFNTVVRLHLSQQCIDEQGLHVGQKVILHQARFQITRLPFSEWHDAVEKVSCWNVLFPTLAVERIPILETQMVKLNPAVIDPGLLYNEGQMAVVRSILAGPRRVAPSFPPIVIQGAFGTGKTFTLAQALKCLLSSKNSSPRIVLCTISNSAADLYLKEHLHPFMVQLQRQGEVNKPRIRRIYKSQRDPKTLDPVVLEYCDLQPSLSRPGHYEFAPASLSDVNNSQLIISNLVGVMDLERLVLPKDTFTHIFLDEAAQSFEADALKALCLAGPQTRVVLAGDPRQMTGGTIYCQLLKRYGFDKSLIERIGHYYQQDAERFVDAGYAHVLQTNYRCHPKIMSFIQANFYPDVIGMNGDYQCSFTDYFPFRFYNTDCNAGFEQYHQPSSTFFNYVEACEVQTRVVEMLMHWPEPFADFDVMGNPKSPPSNIAVIAASDAQVMLLQQKMREFVQTRDVSVSHISWLQGLEFRAIFISTVRTIKPENAEEEQFDLAFLNDKRLLNTAITRAKSVVVIVGSERTLTSVGACRNIWRNLIQSCKANYTFFEAKPMARNGLPVEATRETAKKMLQVRFDKVTVIPDYAEQRLMASSSNLERKMVSNTLPNKILTTRGFQIVEPETSDLKRLFPSLVDQICRIFVNNAKQHLPWAHISPSPFIWVRVIGSTEYFNGVKQYPNLMNKIEADVAAELIQQLINRTEGEVLVVSGTAAQASLIKKFLVSAPHDRFTVIDITYPLPRGNFRHVVFSLVKTSIKGDRAFQQERLSPDRIERAKSALGRELVDMDRLSRIVGLNNLDSFSFVGNHFNASVHPVFDWLYKVIAQEGGAVDRVRDLVN